MERSMECPCPEQEPQTLQPITEGVLNATAYSIARRERGMRAVVLGAAGKVLLRSGAAARRREQRWQEELCFSFKTRIQL
jgi:hypothetical protein